MRRRVGLNLIKLSTQDAKTESPYVYMPLGYGTIPESGECLGAIFSKHFKANVAQKLHMTFRPRGHVHGRRKQLV